MVNAQKTLEELAQSPLFSVQLECVRVCVSASLCHVRVSVSVSARARVFVFVYVCEMWYTVCEMIWDMIMEWEWEFELITMNNVGDILYGKGTMLWLWTIAFTVTRDIAFSVALLTQDVLGKRLPLHCGIPLFIEN